MEVESKTEVKEGLENPEVDGGLKVEESEDLSTNRNDPMIESVAELCELHRYELATSDPSVKSSQIVVIDSNCPPQPDQSQLTRGSELKSELLETVVAVMPQQAMSTNEKSVNVANFEPIESSDFSCTVKVEESEAAEEFDASKKLKVTEELKTSKELNAAEEPADDSVIISEADSACVVSDSKPSSTSDEPDVSCVEESPQLFMNRLNSMLAVWKDCKGVCPPEVEQIIQESNPTNSTSQVVNSEESINTSEWKNMNYSEKIISARQAGIPREEAVTNINEKHLKRGKRISRQKTSSQEVQSHSSQSAETCPSTDGDTEKVADKTEELEFDLNDEELITFRALCKIGMPRDVAWARIQESRAKWENCGNVNVWNIYHQTVRAKLAAARAQKLNRFRKPLMSAKQERQQRARIFNRFNKEQRDLYNEMREKDRNMSHPDAVNKVMEMSGKLGITNIKLDNLLSAGGHGTSTQSVINQAQVDGTRNSPTLGNSAVAKCQQPMEGTENESSDIYECCKRYPEYTDFILGLIRDPRCKHSLDEIIKMAERIPDGLGIFARKLFVLRCYELGVDPEGWDWKQYSEIPPVPKILKAPPPYSNKRTIHPMKRKQPSCTHASCKYHSAPFGFPLEGQPCQGSSRAYNVGVRNDKFRPGPSSYEERKSSCDESREIRRVEFPIKGQPCQGNSRAYNVGVRNDTFRPHLKDPRDLSGVPPFVVLDEPGPSSYEERKSSCDEPRGINRMKFPLDGQPCQGNSRAYNVGVRNDTFRPHLKDPYDLSGTPPLVALDEPGPSSYEERKSSCGESREIKRIEFVEEPSADFLPVGTRPTDDLRLYIVPSLYPSDLLDEEEMYAIEDSILEAIFDIRDERMRPNFNGSFHNKGRYEVICQDQFSKEWLYKYIGLLSPSAYLKIIPAELSRTSAVPPPCNNYQNHESRFSHAPVHVTTCSSNSHEQGSRERSVCVENSQRALPSSSKQSLQDRLGPKVQVAHRRDSSMLASSTQDEPRTFKSYSPNYSGEPSKHTSRVVSSSSARKSHERIRVEGTRSPSPVYNHSRYIEPSLHDIRHDASRSLNSNYRDYDEHYGYIEPSRYTQPSSSYRDSLDGYDSNLEVTRSRSPEYSRSRYIEPARSYSHADTDDEELYSDYTDYETLISGQNDGRRRHRSPSPEYRGSSNPSGYYESSHDSYHRTHSPEEPRSDARERLMRIRTNRTSVDFVERDRSPPQSSYPSRVRHRERLGSPPPFSKSAGRASRSKYDPSRQDPPPFSRHFSKHL